MTTIDLPNIIFTDKLNQTPIIHGDDNYLISTAQLHEFGVAVKIFISVIVEGGIFILKTGPYQ